MTNLGLASVLIILLFHWLADFVAQPHWMSIGKSTSWKILSYHSWRIAYGSLAAGALIIFMVYGNNASDLQWWKVWGFVGINGGSHFLIDAVTSRINAKLWKQERVHEFFVSIGFDQFLHLSIAVATLSWLIL